MNVSVEILPYLLSVVIAFAVWAILYSPVGFEKMRLNAGNDDKAAMENNMWLKLFCSLVIRLVQMYILIHMINYMWIVDGLDTLTVVLAARTAFWMWLWFSMIAHFQENLWKKDINRTLFALNSFWTLCMLIAGGIWYVRLTGIL